jgi:pimeloyl-ACP methyl ester carboxylesterase
MTAMRGFYQRVGRSNHPVMLIWGQEDNTIPYKNYTTLLEAIPRVRFHSIEQAGHVPHYERPAVVNPFLIDFLTSSLYS